ncbi:MAG: phosphotransferase, partial [Syntrophothermus sp.]
MSIVKFAPAFTLEDARQIVKELYGPEGQVEALPSERDQNFVVTCESGKKYVLKIANSTEEKDLLEAQNQVMEHMAQIENLLPNIVPSQKGHKIESIKGQNGSVHFLRLVTYLPGTPMGNVKRHTPQLLFDLGQKLARFDHALQGFDHPALHRDFYWDFANGLKIVGKNINLVQDGELRSLLESLTANFEKFTLPLLSGLKKSTIYNDANDFNILLGGGDDIYSRNQSVAGFIDLGDMVYGTTVGDLAIAIAYAILDKPQPLESAAEVVKGYHSILPLDEEELSALFGLITMRLCMSVCIAAEQQMNQPGNEYLGVSQIPIRSILFRLLKFHPRFAEAVFRRACNLAPFASSPKKVEWLQANSASFGQVLPFDLRTEPLLVLDLSVGSPLLHGNPLENSEPLLTSRIHELVSRAGVRAAVGQYDEARYRYVSPAFGTGDGFSGELRTIHLGMDLFVEVGTPVHAPLDGRVAAFAENASPHGCGPVIVLAHETDENHLFYTLYGHLTRESIAGLKIGQRIQKGEKFASVGKASENGGWTPHLHFQIVNDLLDLG